MYIDQAAQYSIISDVHIHFRLCWTIRVHHSTMISKHKVRYAPVSPSSLYSLDPLKNTPYLVK